MEKPKNLFCICGTKSFSERDKTVMTNIFLSLSLALGPHIDTELLNLFLADLKITNDSNH